MKYLAFAQFVLLAKVFAEEKDAEEVEVVQKPALSLPSFPDSSSILFFEDFQGSSLDSLGWVLSEAEEYSNQEVGLEDEVSAFEGDKSLSLKKKHVRYGLSKALKKPLDMTSDEIVVQFEARASSKISCSGSYIKFVSEDVKEDQKAFSEKTDYVVMFGPDKCGSNQKLHTIFKHKNPVSGELEEKHMQDIKRPDNDKVTHTYTLIIDNKESLVKVLVDQSEKGAATATEENTFKPSFLPPEEIDDPEDKKPEDWVDNAKMEDPEATKPEDWVEEEYIVDPESTKPDDWDDEEDGEWEPAQIANPEYKGEWSAPLIDNPDYKGPWAPKKIKNPNFFVQEFPLKTLSKVTHVFIEVLANDEGISFDNILITTNKENAKVIAEKQGLEKQKLEKENISSAEAKKEKEERDRKLNEEFGVVSVLEYISGEAKELYAKHTVEFVGVASVVLVAFMYFCVLRSSGKAAEDTVGESKKKDDEKEESEAEEDEKEEPKRKSVRRRAKKAD